MAANMAANFMKNENIHKGSCYNMLPVCFWTQNVFIEDERCKL